MWLFLILALYFCYFFRLSHLGLYEDDFYYITTGLNLNGHDFLHYWRPVFHDFNQGRPLHIFFGILFPFLFRDFGGLTGLYGAGLLIESLNGYLFFMLLRKYNFKLAAFIAPFILILSAADTNRLLLHYIFTVQF